MNLYTGAGKSGVALAIILAIAMCLLSLLFHPVEINSIPYGLCLPSPDSWNFERFWSWGINTALIGLIAVLLLLLNRSYNFIRTTEPVLIIVFLIMAASSPWFTQGLNTSVLLCLSNVVCMGIIFDTYDTKNATQEMFTIGVTIGFGSMVQYAFLPMMPVYLLWALFMKVLRIKETLALFAGIFCPYWIAFGTGWMSLSDFKFPSLTPLFTYSQDPSEFFILLSGIALAATIGLILTLTNAIKLYAGNSRVNAMNLCVEALGAASVICILVDFDNLHAYVITLYAACAVQIANVCALWTPRMPWLVSAIPSLLYMAIFVCSIVL